MSARSAPVMVRAAPLGLPFGLALFLLLVALCWVGFVGSDDVTYSRGAYGWIEQFPFVGGHGTIRYPLTIPMAVSLLALGENEYALVAPSLLYAVALIALIWWWVKRATDAVSAALAVLSLVTLPQLVVISTYANVEAVEALFLFLSVYLTWRCLDEGPGAGRLVLAGMFAGLAFLARETAIFVVPFYAALFLYGHRFHRGHYLWIVAGFLIVWAAELLYLGLMTGDPLYRIHVSLHHDPSIDRSVDLAGNIIVHPLIDPLLVLLLNQEFMLLFFLAIPLGAWLCFGRGVDERTRHFARIVSLFGLSWFLCAAAAQSLLPLNPRYFLISAICAAILTGVALARLLQSGKDRVRLAAGVAGLALLGANGLGLAAENKDLRFGERVLARIAAERPGQAIVTDPMTRYRADLLLRWASADDRVGQRPPAAGDLYLHNPAHAEKGNARMSAALVPIYRPKPDWKAIARYEPESPYLARTIEIIGVAELIPASIWRKLRFRHAPVTLYRVGGEGSTGGALEAEAEAHGGHLAAAIIDVAHRIEATEIALPHGDAVDGEQADIDAGTGSNGHASNEAGAGAPRAIFAHERLGSDTDARLRTLREELTIVADEIADPALGVNIARAQNRPLLTGAGLRQSGSCDQQRHERPRRQTRWPASHRINSLIS